MRIKYIKTNGQLQKKKKKIKKLERNAREYKLDVQLNCSS